VVFKAVAGVLAVGAVGLSGVVAIAGDPLLDCLSTNNELRITGCSELIERPDLPAKQRSMALGLRALAYSVKGEFERALGDYDEAIRIAPDSPVTLNNRAWTYFKLGRSAEGKHDVARALELGPPTPYVLDTRAHIRQALGDVSAALSDYELAIRYGGRRIVRLYQCGLRSQGLYGGRIDGIYSPTVKRALEICVANRGCDPLPDDEECRPTVS